MNDSIINFLKTAQDLIVQDNLEDALKILNKILEKDPYNIIVLTKIGYIHMINGNLKEAVKFCDTAIKANYDYCMEKNDRLSEHFESKRNSERKINDILDDYFWLTFIDETFIFDMASKISDAYFYKGIALRNMNRYEESIKTFQKLIVLNEIYDESRNENIYLEMGDSFYDMNLLEDSIDCFDKVIEINPQNINAYVNKGNSLLIMNREEEAILLYDLAIKINPNHDSAYWNKGLALNELNKKEEAIKYYDMAIEILPSPLYLAKKAIVLKSMNNLDEAFKCLKEADQIMNDPNFNRFKYNLDPIQVSATKKYLKLLTEMTKDLKIIENDINQLKKKGTDITEYNRLLTNFMAGEYNKKINDENNQNINNVLIEINKMKQNINNLLIDNLEIKQELSNKLDDVEKIFLKSILNFNKEEQHNLKNYYSGFLKTMSNLFTTSQVIISDKIKIEDSSDIGGLLSTLAAYIPIFGETASTVIGTIDSLVVSSKLKTAANNFLSLFIDHIYLNKVIGNVLLRIIKNQELVMIILNSNKNIINESEKSTFKKILGFFNDMKEKIEITMYSELYKTEFEKLGNQDANILIEELLKLKGIKDEINLEEYSEKQLLSSKTKLDHDKNEKELNKTKCSCGCLIF